MLALKPVYEDYTESLALQGCAQTATAHDEQFDSWPTDFNNDQTVNTTDVLALKPVFLQSGSTVERYDLAPSGDINTTDVLAMKPVFLQNCTP
ncbi:MAG TPA: dockerin type I domain-containing protein [Dehalococcoidia bacterium]|nr:dockerin type I domain-containing protein [Dehalococcoidia bacterium]